MRSVIVFGKSKKPCKGMLGGTEKFKVAHFRQLFRRGILKQIRFKFRKEFYIALRRVSRNPIALGRKAS